MVRDLKMFMKLNPNDNHKPNSKLTHLNSGCIKHLLFFVINKGMGIAVCIFF